MIELRVDRGALVPADDAARDQLRGMGLGIGEVVHATVHKPRNPRFFRLAHRIAKLVRQNIDGFDLLDDHGALKRLQLEAGVECDEMRIIAPGFGPATVQVPRSLAFDSMPEHRFRAMIEGICVHIARVYWPRCDPAEVERMAEVMVE